MSNDDAKAHKISRMIGVAGVLFLSCACGYFLSMKVSVDKELVKVQAELEKIKQQRDAMIAECKKHLKARKQLREDKDEASPVQ